MKRYSRARYALPAVGLGVVLALAGCSTEQPASTETDGPVDFTGQTLVVTVYGGATEEFVRDEIVPQFEEETGAHVELSPGLSQDWVTKMRVAGKDDPPYDVLVISKLRVPGLKDAGFFEKLSEKNIPNLADVAKPLRDEGDIGVQGLFQPVGFAYRTDLIETPPKSWADLESPEYQGKLCLYNPAANTGGIMTMMMLGELYGDGPTDVDAAFEQIKNLEPFKRSDFDMATPLTRGECAIAVVDSPAAMDLKIKGAPVEFVVPSDGAFLFEQDLNVASGSTVKPLAEAYVNYMLSAEVQEKWANKFYVSPVNVKAEISPEAAENIFVTTDDLDSIRIWTDKEAEWIENEGSELIADRWNREVG